MSAGTDGSGKRGTHGHIQVERLEIIAGLLTTCTSPMDIEHQLATEWSCSTATVRRYIRRVRDKWAAQGVQADKEERAFSRVRNKRILEQVVFDQLAGKRPDHMIVLRAVNELNRMDGLHRDRLELTGRGLGGASATSDKLLGKLRDIEKKLAGGHPVVAG